VLVTDIVALAVGWPLLTFAFGWAVLGRLGGLDREERFAASFGVGFAFVAAAQFVAFLIAAPHPLFRPLFSLAVVGLMLLVTAACRFRRPPAAANNRLPWALAGLLVLVYLHLLCVQALLPCYVGSSWWGDWHHHFLAARVWLGDLPVDTEWQGYTIASRTPLFNLATAFPLNFVGPEFWAFQTASVAPSICFVLPAYLLLRDGFDRRVAVVAFLLAPLNLWLLHIAWFTWPKMLAAYYLLLGLHFYLQALRRRTEPAAARRYFLSFWIAALLSYLSHQVALVYAAPLLLHAALVGIVAPAFRPRPRDLAVLAAVALLALGPWYGWLLVRIGPTRIATGTPATQMNVEVSGPGDLIRAVGYNLVTSTVPVHLIEALEKPPGDPEREAEAYRGLTELYFSLATGAVTLSLAGFLLVRLLVGLCRGEYRAWAGGLLTPEGTAVAVFAVAGTLFAAPLHTARCDHGIAHAALFSSVVLVVVLGWGMLARAPRPVVALVCLGMLAEFQAMFWTHLAALEEPLLLDPYNYNIEAKQNEEVAFLFDELGLGPGPPAVTTAVVQALLGGLLAWWVLGGGGTAGGEGVSARPVQAALTRQRYSSRTG
jgi:hypothetical protein